MSELNQSLKGKKVFISASFPEHDAKWPKEYMTVNPFVVLDGVNAFVHAILSRNGTVVYGGHPSINPMVINIARKFSKEPSSRILVHLYQTLYFHNQYSDEVKDLMQMDGLNRYNIKVRETADLGDKDKSLKRMREQMFAEQQPDFAVFLGGKDGIKKEYEMYNGRAYPIGISGGESGEIFKEQPTSYKEFFGQSQSLPIIARRVIEDFLRNPNSY